MRARRPLASLAPLLLVACFAACNSVFGIEQRELLEDTSGELSCDLYCNTVVANCAAEFAQYQSYEVCVAACALIPLGTDEDTSGNTIGCRMRNAELAASTGERADHCPLAGPASGAPCGDRCTNFCGVFDVACAGQSAVAGAACPGFCASSIDNPAWTPLDPQQLDHDDSIQCRIWHLANSAQSSIHCGHADGTTKCELIAEGVGGSGGGG